MSITLPNNVLITLESDNSEPVHEVLALILSSVQTDSRLNSEAQTGVDVNRENTAEKGNGVLGSRTSQGRVPAAEFANGLDRDDLPDMIPEPSNGASLNGWNGHTQEKWETTPWTWVATTRRPVRISWRSARQ